MPRTPAVRLTELQEKAAALIAHGYKQSEVGIALGKSKPTINHWAKNPLFQDRVNRLQTDLVKEAEEVLDNSVKQAAEALVDIATGQAVKVVEGEIVSLDSSDMNPRLRAAIYILDRALKRKLPPKRPPSARRGVEQVEEENEAPMSQGFDDEEVDDILSRVNGTE